MCTRYLMELSPQLRPIIEAAGNSPLASVFTEKTGRSMITEGEIRPGDTAPVIATSRKGIRTAYPMAFGFKASSGGLVLNARLETASQKPMFREAWTRRRCIIPASAYFEWMHTLLPDGKKKTGERYTFRAPDSPVTWLGGLYRIENDLPYFVILTRDAVGEPARIHNRMPLILPDAVAGSWINPDAVPEELLQQAGTVIPSFDSGNHTVL